MVKFIILFIKECYNWKYILHNVCSCVSYWTSEAKVPKNLSSNFSIVSGGIFSLPVKMGVFKKTVRPCLASRSLMFLRRTETPVYITGVGLVWRALNLHKLLPNLASDTRFETGLLPKHLCRGFTCWSQSNWRWNEVGWYIFSGGWQMKKRVLKMFMFKNVHHTVVYSKEKSETTEWWGTIIFSENIK